MAEIAMGRLARVGALMSIHDRASDIARLNACASTHPLSVHPWTAEVIEEALHLANSSSGVFDFVQPPPGETRRDGTSSRSFLDIELLPTRRVKFHRPVSLNLDAIAQGYAVDKAVEYLRDCDIESAEVSVDGQRRVLGTRPACEAVLHLHDPPFSENWPLTHCIPIPAVATAPTSIARFHATSRNRVRLAPFRHPTSGRTLRTGMSLSIFARTCVAADALLRAAWGTDKDPWFQWLARENAAATLLTADGQIVRLA
jgi:thiamine biosynthesis lipoprotein